MVYWLMHTFLRLFSFCYFPIKVRGIDRLPKDGPYLIASNHISNLDPVIIGLACRRKLSYMAKVELFSTPILKYLLDNVEAFPVNRHTSDFKAMRETFRRLKRGFPVVMFPEGTRVAEEGKKQIHAGVGFLAVKSRLPVIPIYIHNSDKVLPPGSRFPQRSTVNVYIGEPLSFGLKDPYIDVTDKVMKQISHLSSIH